MTSIPGLCALCPRCKRRHRPDLPCWGGRLVKQLHQLVFAEHGDTCWLCGHPGADTVDHVTSRAMGGTDALANLRPAHAFCNTGRGAGALSAPSAAETARPVTEEKSSRW